MNFNAYRIIAIILNLCVIAAIWLALDGSVILKVAGSIGWLCDSLFIFSEIIGDKNEN